MANKIGLSEDTSLNVSVKTIIGICFGLLTLAGVYFGLTAEMEKLKVNNVRMENELMILRGDSEEFKGDLSKIQLNFSGINAKLNQLQIDNGQMHNEIEMNSNFRIKWPLGELGALPDDAEQNIKILYLTERISKIESEIKK